MNVEEQLKVFILEKYRSIREFALEIDMPYSTLDTIFKRGVGKANVTNIIKICKSLSVDATLLAEGQLMLKQDANTSPTQFNLSKNEQKLLNNYNQLNENGKQKASDYVEDLAGNRKYLKNTDTEKSVEFSRELA